MGKSQNKSVQSSWQNQQNTLDPYIDEMRRKLGTAADSAAAAQQGDHPLLSQAGGFFGALQNLGLGASQILGGNGQAISGAMNPYLESVIGSVGTEYDKLRTGTTNALNDQATKAGAFGGSRHGVAQGVALGELGSAEMAQKANLLKSGYDDVMTRALQTANLGFGAAGAGAQLGQYMQENSPEMRRLGIFGRTIAATPYTVNSSMQGKTKGTDTRRGASVGFDWGPFKVGAY